MGSEPFLPRRSECTLQQDDQVDFVSPQPQENWSPALTISKLMAAYRAILQRDPDVEHPFVPEIAQQFQQNRDEHDAKARAWTKQFAV